MMDYMKNYKNWINSKIIDENSKAELIGIRSNNFELKERFYKDLEFGTGGIRGLVGAGINRINIYTVKKATQGLANFINGSNFNEIRKSVAIAYDSRHYSEIFAEEAALVLAANNIKAYVFESLRSTPELSFAIRHLSCDAGIVITASHNPPEYNGYKVYGPDGGQITLETANAITSEINKLDIFDVKTCPKEEAIIKGLFSYIGDEIDNEYLNRVTELSIHPNISKEVSDFIIVYTPLHGAGLMPIERALSMLGYANVNIVETQRKPDGNFPTVKTPNPEEREALSEGIKLAELLNADIVIGTDPDVDRVGVAVRNDKGIYILLTGNQIGALLTHYLISNKKDINYRNAVIKTIVTSELGANIAKSYGATVFDTLTGFKFIGEKIKEFEAKNDYDFLFGYEESYGYLAGTFVRDKDAVISSTLIVEMAACYKLKHKTLIDALDGIYKEYGYYTDALDSFTFQGVEGQNKIKSIVDKFRNNAALMEELPDIRTVEDYKYQKKYDIGKTQFEVIDLPSSNVIKICLSDQSWFAVRPSGTEPKLKIYYSTVDSSLEGSRWKMKELKDKVLGIVNMNDLK